MSLTKIKSHTEQCKTHKRQERVRYLRETHLYCHCCIVIQDRLISIASIKGHFLKPVR